MKRSIHIYLLLTIGFVSSNPLPKNATSSTNLRQDGDGDGVLEGVDGFDAVAGPIAEIITGTLSGNIGQLFNGITGTVTDQEAQPGVGEILTGVSLPLSTLWMSGIAAGQKYFNITTENPLGAHKATQKTPLNGAAVPLNNPNGNVQVVSGNVGAVVVSQEQLNPQLLSQTQLQSQPQQQYQAHQQSQPLQNQPQKQTQVVQTGAAPVSVVVEPVVTPAPVTDLPTTLPSEDDDDDDDDENDLNKNVVVV